MGSLFWSRVHGGVTHFPIALLFGAALFDALTLVRPESVKKSEFAIVGYWLVILAAAGATAAVLSGLALSKWNVGGTGSVLRHHLFVWPAFALIIALATWRFLVGPSPSRQSLAAYVVSAAVACLCIGVAGFFGGEMLLRQ